MHFTREPIIETVLTPKSGYRLVIRSSKSTTPEEYFVEAIEVVSFGPALFFRSIERPKAFLLPVSDYEVFEVRETKLVLKALSNDDKSNEGAKRKEVKKRRRLKKTSDDSSNSVKLPSKETGAELPVKESEAESSEASIDVENDSKEANVSSSEVAEEKKAKKRKRVRSLKDRKSKETSPGDNLNQNSEEKMVIPKLIPPPPNLVSLNFPEPTSPVEESPVVNKSEPEVELPDLGLMTSQDDIPGIPFD